MSRTAVEPLETVLRHGVECLPEEMAVVLIDSALNKSVGQVTIEGLERHFAGYPARFHRALVRADAKSQSGIESLVRLRLRSLGIRVRTQVRCVGVGHVDIVVGDRLVIETDGRETHDTETGFFTDRDRDLVLAEAGYDELRLTYAHVMFRWRDVERVVLGKVRRREHLWPANDPRSQRKCG